MTLWSANDHVESENTELKKREKEREDVMSLSRHQTVREEPQRRRQLTQCTTGL